MLAALVVALRSLALICGGHRTVALENLALRQQLAVFKRTVTSPTPPPRSAVLDAARQRVAGLANSPDRRGPGHRRTLASPLAPPPMGAALSAGPSWSPAYDCSHSDTRDEHGRRESALGRSSHPRRVGQVGH